MGIVAYDTGFYILAPAAPNDLASRLGSYRVLR